MKNRGVLAGAFALACLLSPPAHAASSGESAERGESPAEAVPRPAEAAERDRSSGTLSAETAAGADGVSVALFAEGDGPFSLGLRCGLGFEWTDFRMNDPVVALAVRFRLLSAGPWAWWIGGEAGAAAMDTGYDRFALPFVGASTGAAFRFLESLSAFAEAGGRFGRRDLESAASLDFLETRYEETIFIDPLVLRLGLALRF